MYRNPGGKSMSRKARHPAKASDSIDSSASGNVTRSNAAHPLRTQVGMLRRPGGKTISRNAWQSLNAHNPESSVSVGGRRSLRKAVQSLKKSSPARHQSESGRIASRNAEHP